MITRLFVGMLTPAIRATYSNSLLHKVRLAPYLNAKVMGRQRRKDQRAQESAAGFTSVSDEAPLK